MSTDVHAYRALVDRERFALVHATDLLEAGKEFRKEFPGHPFVAQRAPWNDTDREPGVEVRTRQFPIR